MEYVISEELLASITGKYYKAGKLGREVFTVRAPSESIVRCIDCKYFQKDATPFDCDGFPHFCTKHGIDMENGNGFCSWASRS